VDLLDVSAATVYRALKELHRPKDLRRSGRGRLRTPDEEAMIPLF